MKTYTYMLLTECDSTCTVLSDKRLHEGDEVTATFTLENGAETRRAIIKEIVDEDISETSD